MYPRTSHASMEHLRYTAFRTGLGAVSLASAHDGDDDNGGWPIYNHDAQGTRHKGHEQLLNRQNVSRSRAIWSFPISGVVSGTPVVHGELSGVATAGGISFQSDFTGLLFALDARI